MNRAAITQLADAIEAASRPIAQPNVGFNMGDYIATDFSLHDQTGHSCGATACLAGWAVGLDRGWDRTVFVLSSRTHEEAACLLGLSWSQAADLFLGWPQWYLMRREEVRADTAVRCLRILAREGRVDWSQAYRETCT